MSSMMEEWRAIAGYEGLYEVSDLGRVRSLHARHLGNPKILAFGTDETGYPTVMLSKKCVRKPYTVHRLVALAFHGDKRNALHREVAHLDGSKTNAAADNLKWVSKIENESHKRMHGTRKSALYSRLTEEDVVAIKAKLAAVAHAKIAEEYGVSIYTIRHIASGTRWGYVPRPDAPLVSRSKRLTDEQTQEIGMRHRKGERCVDLAKEFGVSRATAYRAAAIAERRATVWPMFTSRTLRPPQPFGHRRYLDQRMIASRR